MKKNLFITKNNKKFFYILIGSLSIILLYIIILYININKKFFTKNNTNEVTYYIIPDDKEGEKVKFINKKSINELSSSNDVNDLISLKNLYYTIQLYSDINIKKIENYLKNLLSLKSHIISSDDLYIFSVNTQIGTDYFLTYKNFVSKSEALSYCEKLSFIKKCLIINHQS